MKPEYIIRKKNKVYKPVPLKVLKRLAYERLLSPGDMVSADGGQTWTLADKMPVLHQFFPSDTAPLSLAEVPRGYSGKIERKRRSIEVIDMIPMIDMVFLLLIFFALTSTFEIQRVMEMNLPEATTGDRLQAELTLTLHIKNDNQLLLENAPVALHNLSAAIGDIVRQSSRVTLVIKGDAQVPHGRVVEVMDITHASGVEKILIAVKKQ
jgi:biopolymer transport protein ExbD